MAKKSLFGSIQRLGEDRYRVYWTHDGARKSKVIRGTRDEAEIFLASMRTGRIPDQPWGTYYKNVVHPTLLLADLPAAGPLCPSKNARMREGEWKEDAYVSPITFTHNWRAWCGDHGVDYIRPGDMRSIWSTWHGEAGSPDSLVSMAMGHSDGSTRGRNYQMNTRRGMALIADSLTALIESTWNQGSMCRNALTTHTDG